MFETIVALATPPSKSALAIIRFSGDDCFDVVSRFFSKDLKTTKKREIVYGFIKEGNKTIDQVILLTYVAPNSFTGENSIEIICHGSMVIANEIISLSLKYGARLATNGEFSSRAYLNGKIDLIQAEAINDMINATTKEAKDLSLLSLQGKTSALFKPLKEKLGELLASIEVNIDYPEYEDIEEVNREDIISTCTYLSNEINKLIVDGERDRIYREGIDIAIVGKPNVGKSSLLNALLHQEKAIVTDIAGTTRDVVEGDLNLCGVPVHLFDTAGVRESKDIIEKLGIEKTKNAINSADLIIYLKDSSGIDNELYELVKDKKHIIVTNKSDLINNKSSDEIYISAKNNDIDNLVLKIKSDLNIGELTMKPSFCNTRQLGLLRLILEHIELAINDTKNNQPIDLVSTSLMLAYNCSLDLIGENNKNDISSEIFSRFCVGK